MSHTDSALQRTACSLALDGRTHARYSESASRLVARPMGLGHSRAGTRCKLHPTCSMLHAALPLHAAGCCTVMPALCAPAPLPRLLPVTSYVPLPSTEPVISPIELSVAILCARCTLHVALLTLRRAFSCCLRTQPVPSSALPMLARPRHHSAPTARTVPQSPHGPPQYRRL